MTRLSIDELQDYLTGVYEKKGVTVEGLFLKLVEEMGEVAEIINIMDGRKKKTKPVHIGEELADMLHYIFAIESLLNLDLTKIIFEKDSEAAIRYGHEMNLMEYIKNSRKNSDNAR